MARADEHDVADLAVEEFDPPVNERAHEDFAQLTVGLHDGKKAFAIELDHSARFAHARLQKRAPSGQHVDLIRELSGAMHDHDPLAFLLSLHDLDLPDVTTKKGIELSPASKRMSPRRTSRVRPCAASRSICCGVSLGNASSARDAPVMGSAVTVSVIPDVIPPMRT